MNKFQSWLSEDHVGEVGFAVLMSILTFLMIWFAWDADSVNGSVYPTSGLVLTFAFYCAYAFMLERFAQNVEELRRLKVFSAFLLLVVVALLLIFSFHIQQKVTVTEFIKVGFSGICCALFCSWYLTWRIGKMQELEFLRDNRPSEYIRALIDMKKVLSVDQQLKIFYLGDAEQLLFKYMQYEDLCEAAEIKLIDQPYADKLLNHLTKYSFSDNGDAYLFRVANAPRLVKIYVENGNAFSANNDVKMFDLPNAAEVVEIYISNYYLSDAAELRLFELPNAEEMVKYYAETYDFDMCDEAYELAEEKGWI